jgi:hypothetical protein
VKEEPAWRVILNWGVVFYFLGLPLMAIFLGFTHIRMGEGTNIAKFLSDFHFSVSALVAAIAGLNTFDRFKENGKSKPAQVDKEERRS